MTFRPLSSQNSLPANFSQINDMVRDLNKRERVSIFKDDAGVRRVLLGKGANGFYGLKVSQEGQDVFTAEGDDLVFNSDNNLFKIVSSGTIIAPAVTTVGDGTNTYSGSGATSVAHGLSFTPLAIAFVEVSAAQYSLMPYTETTSASVPSGGIVSEFFRLTTSSTNIEVLHSVVSYSPGVSGGTYSGANIRYFLLRETAT